MTPTSRVRANLSALRLAQLRFSRFATARLHFGQEPLETHETKLIHSIHIPFTMSASSSTSLRVCLRAARRQNVCRFARPTVSSSQRVSRRWQSTDAAAPTNPKIAGIVDQISQLTLLETADLVASLKVCVRSMIVVRENTDKGSVVTIKYPRYAYGRLHGCWSSRRCSTSRCRPCRRG